MPKLALALLAALASAALAKQNYRQVPIPIPQGRVVEPIALNSRGQALATHCDHTYPAQCAAVLWTEKGGLVTILEYTSGAADQFQLNDWGEVAALRTQSQAQTVALWSPRDGWRDLATFPLGRATVVALNNLGVVLGQTLQGAFLASRALGVQFIPALTGEVTVKAMNDAGAITGTVGVPCPPNTCTGSVGFAFRWTPWDGLTILDHRSFLIGPASVGLAVNRAGDVSGILYAPSFQHPFLWTEREGMQDLGPAPGRLPTFGLLNDHRELVGWWLFGPYVRSFFRSEKSGIVDIGTLGGSQAFAFGLNNKGEVVGYSSLPENYAMHAFLWSLADGMTDLGVGEPIAINDQGLIFGCGGPTGLCVWAR